MEPAVGPVADRGVGVSAVVRGIRRTRAADTLAPSVDGAVLLLRVRNRLLVHCGAAVAAVRLETYFQMAGRSAWLADPASVLVCDDGFACRKSVAAVGSDG